MSRTTIETWRGHYFDFADPRAEDVKIEDIAHALSQTCRFGGHTRRFYSVAEHALFVHDLVRPAAPAVLLAALHHDSHEAYLGDVPTPLKRLLDGKFIDLVIAADEAIGEAFGIAPDLFNCMTVVEADELALRVEAYILKPSQGVGEHWGYDQLPPGIMSLAGRRPLAPEEACSLFIKTHREVCAV